MYQKRRNNTIKPEEAKPVLNPLQGLNFDKAYQIFIQDCRLRNLSEHTVKYYQDRLTEFKKRLVDAGYNTDPESITLDDIKQIIIYHLDRGNKETTVNNRLRAVRAFFNFLFNEGYISKNPVERLKMVKENRKIVESFTGEQAKIILAQADQRTFTGLRDFTIMLLMLETGVRVRELADIKLQDINWQENLVKINGKGYKQRLLPFQITVKKQLELYVKVRGDLDTDNLFVTIDNTPITGRQIQWRIYHYGKTAGLKGVRVSPHTFRHTFAKFYILNGGDPFSLRHLLGHTTFEMTNRYVSMFSGETTAQHKKYSPVEGLF